MNRAVRKLILVSFLGFSGSLAFCQNKENTGFISIVSSHPITEVMIDDSAVGHWDSVPCGAGAHKITVRNPDRLHFQRTDFEKHVELQSGEHLRIIVAFETLSEINSYPMSAAVLSGQTSLGFTPLYLPLSEYKNSILQFKKTGFNDAYVAVSDSVIRRDYVFAALTPRIKSISNNDNEFVNLQWREQGPYKYKVPIIVNATLSVATGGVAAYFKHKADSRFEKAKLARRNGDTARQGQLVRQTHRYDRYSTIGFVAMQVNMAALIYFLLKSK
jgi:hypothetical protein